MTLSQTCPGPGGLKHKLLSAVLEPGKPEVKALADLVSGGGPVLLPHMSEGPRSSLGSHTFSLVQYHNQDIPTLSFDLIQILPVSHVYFVFRDFIFLEQF